MEYIDIFDENNNPTGEVKEKKPSPEIHNKMVGIYAVHTTEDGDLLIKSTMSSKVCNFFSKF